VGFQVIQIRFVMMEGEKRRAGEKEGKRRRAGENEGREK
jgi:hypothetical protein